MASPAWVTNYDIRNEIANERHPLDLARENLKLQFELAEHQRLERELRATIAHLESLILELRQTQDQMKTLRGVLPICSSCKKIRDEHGYWKQLEIYIRQHSNADFSHGICPECASRYYHGYNLHEPEGR